jgi:hypothetical protein
MLTIGNSYLLKKKKKEAYCGMCHLKNCLIFNQFNRFISENHILGIYYVEITIRVGRSQFANTVKKSLVNCVRHSLGTLICIHIIQVALILYTVVHYIGVKTNALMFMINIIKVTSITGGCEFEYL